MSEDKHVRVRGRPRTNPYFDIAEFAMEFEELKKDFLFRRKILATLIGVLWQNREELDNTVFVDKPGQLFSMVQRSGPRYKYHGNGFRCSKCGKISAGKDFTVDEDHKPPRVRFTLDCGHRQEVVIETSRPTACPKCGGELQQGGDGLLFCVACDWKEAPSVPAGKLTREETELLRRLKH